MLNARSCSFFLKAERLFLGSALHSSTFRFVTNPHGLRSFRFIGKHFFPASSPFDKTQSAVNCHSCSYDGARKDLTRMHKRSAVMNQDGVGVVSRDVESCSSFHARLS